MKIICSLSSLEFSCEHFPGSFSSPETHHPVFSLPQKKLLSYTGKWAANQLTPVDSYLLFLATLKSSGLVSFRCPAIRTEQTDAIIAQCMEKLFAAVIKLNTADDPVRFFPSYVISVETRTLSNVIHWIANWEEAFKEFKSKSNRDYDYRKLQHRETALQRMIKNPHKTTSAYASQIAEWAAVAGMFPTFMIKSPITGLQIPLAEYWKTIIIRCTKKDAIHSIDEKDLKELRDHCFDGIECGTIYSKVLFKVLDEAIEKKRNYLGIGDLDVRTGFTILDTPTTVEESNLMALISSAPEHEPKESDYPTKFAFQKAKMRWTLSQKFSGQDTSGQQANQVNKSIKGKLDV